MKYIDKNLKIIETKDGSMSLYNVELNESYHSRRGAIEETDYVYIKQGLEFVIQELGMTNIKIFELGFGTGSNLLLTLEYVLTKNNIKINFKTIEKYPISFELINQLNYNKFSTPNCFNLFLTSHKCSWDTPIQLTPEFRFTKFLGDIHNLELNDTINLVYYDAFAPKRQADVWDKAILQKLYDKLTINGTLVTYCSQGQFKRDLAEVGFEVTTLQGPPFKKEMIRAIKK